MSPHFNCEGKTGCVFQAVMYSTCGQGGASFTGPLMSHLLNTLLKASIVLPTSTLRQFIDEPNFWRTFLLSWHCCWSKWPVFHFTAIASRMAAGPVQALRGQWTWYSFHMALRSWPPPLLAIFTPFLPARTEALWAEPSTPRRARPFSTLIVALELIAQP